MVQVDGVARNFSVVVVGGIRAECAAWMASRSARCCSSSLDTLVAAARALPCGRREGTRVPMPPPLTALPPAWAPPLHALPVPLAGPTVRGRCRCLCCLDS